MSQLTCSQVLQLLNRGGELPMGIVPGLLNPREQEILE